MIHIFPTAFHINALQPLNAAELSSIFPFSASYYLS